MKIRTVGQLNETLSDELAWRKKELSTLKLLAEEKNNAAGKRDTLIRSGVALLHAHWEGFIKAASVAYLEFVAAQRLKYNELAPNFVALGMRAELNEAGAAFKSEIHNRVADFFINRLSEESNIPYNDVIRTSNLNAMELKNIVAMLGLDYTPFEPKENLLDEQLLKSRNNIAHGAYLRIDLQEYVEVQIQVIEMMDLFRNFIENAALMESYRVKPPVQ